jgi:5-methylcytosine-specific restriction endonuclease McrA
MPRKSIASDLRRRVRQRAENRCEYCHYPQVACYAAFHCDHFISDARGGSTDFDNLVFACPTCNASKHARVTALDRATGQVVPLFNPRTDSWHDHFEWSESGLKLLPRTPCGRVTIRLLRMNRRGVAVVRSMLIELGLHPAD